MSGDKTTNINSEGYYYFYGNFWIKFGTLSGQTPDTSIYKDDGRLKANRNANLNGYNIGFTGNGNVGIGTSTPTEKLQVLCNVAASGNGKFSQKLRVGSNYVGVTLAVDNNDASQPIMAISGTGANRRITVLDKGNTGISTQAPSEKLDVEGNARFRSVPAGNMSSTDDYVAISSNGTLKKVVVNLPTLGLYADTIGSAGHPSNGNLYNLNFDNIQRRYGNFIATSAYQNTFVAAKYGLYTVEAWVLFSNVPQDTNNLTRGI
ncbi:hypothetical protein C1634_024635 [Chryseobacterium viscerum]|uniref:Uncharacterized protein n=1 Tax=Chryseobacterium viscerum TaxID=1037377 RepID=A0A316WB20_9FLAO|nr:hypothetical protein C1634_024635 [Chryseobacterium viscerum]